MPLRSPRSSDAEAATIGWGIGGPPRRAARRWRGIDFARILPLRGRTRSVQGGDEACQMRRPPRPLTVELGRAAAGAPGRRDLEHEDDAEAAQLVLAGAEW